jgi:hypothetical protein
MTNLILGLVLGFSLATVGVWAMHGQEADPYGFERQQERFNAQMERDNAQLFRNQQRFDNMFRTPC